MNNLNGQLSGIDRVSAKADASVASTAYPLTLMMSNVVVILLIASVYAWSQFRTITDYWPIIIAISIGLCVAILGVKPQHRNAVLTSLFVAMVMAAGMLLGSIADFGRLSLAVFNELCTPSANLTLMQDIRRIFSIAPLTHAGMLLGCLFALTVCDLAAPLKFSIRHTVGNCALHLVGMSAAMVLAQVLIRMSTLNDTVIISASTVPPIVLMWMLMAGMAVLLLSFVHTRTSESS